MNSQQKKIFGQVIYKKGSEALSRMVRFSKVYSCGHFFSVFVELDYRRSNRDIQFTAKLQSVKRYENLSELPFSILYWFWLESLVIPENSADGTRLPLCPIERFSRF